MSLYKQTTKFMTINDKLMTIYKPISKKPNPKTQKVLPEVFIYLRAGTPQSLSSTKFFR